MQPLLHCRDGRFHLLGTPALLARSPVKTSQAIEYRAPNLVFGVGFQLDVVPRIEAVNSGDQPDGSRGDQVVQVDAFGKTFVDPPRNQPDLREMFENQTFPFLTRVVLASFRGSCPDLGRASGCIHACAKADGWPITGRAGSRA